MTKLGKELKKLRTIENFVRPIKLKLQDSSVAQIPPGPNFGPHSVFFFLRKIPKFSKIICTLGSAKPGLRLTENK